ncbi:hypothetical protein BCR35DRAFT_312286 [Leucosporidium creatinivorum]|uniref:TRAF-type domain-containing protein n=1 Tax=Leucosporidium creatinivorum TaxID=106004 RepID=A0A1Y2G0M2_9BASI|nr:hypothetical protein BCR35DRAFT_312286 [Leucosporidium creatinivorum]
MDTPAPVPPSPSEPWACSFCHLEQKSDKASLNCLSNSEHKILCCRECATSRLEIVCPFCVPPAQETEPRAATRPPTPAPAPAPASPPTVAEQKESPKCPNSPCDVQGDLELHSSVCYFRTVTCPKDGCETEFQVINAIKHFEIECQATVIPCPRGGSGCSTIFAETMLLMRRSARSTTIAQTRQINEQNQQLLRTSESRLQTSSAIILKLQAEIKQLKRDKEQLKAYGEMWWKAGMEVADIASSPRCFPSTLSSSHAAMLRWLLLLLLAAPSVWSIAITVPSTVVSGEDLDFSWSTGVSPYVLKILINNKVVSQNNDWTSTSNSWTASADTAPVGTIIKIRVIDSDNNMVISTGTEVVERNAHTEQGSVNTAYTATRTTATSGHKSTSPHDGSMTYDSFDMGQATETTDAFANQPSASGGMGTATSSGGSNSTMDGQDQFGASGMGSNDTSSTADPMMATSTSAVAEATAATSLAVATGATAATTSALNISASADSTATDSAASSTSTSSDSSGGTSTTTYIMIGAVVLVLACAVGGGVWWYLRSQKQKDPQQGEKGAHGEEHSDEEALVGGGHGQGDSETDQSEDEGASRPKKGGSGGRKGAESETETEPSESEDDARSNRRK